MRLTGEKAEQTQGPAGQQVEQEPAVGPCSKGHQPHPESIGESVG